MASDDVKHAEGIADPDAMGDSKSKQEVVGDALEEPDASALSGFKLYAVAIGVSFGALMMSLDVSIIGTVQPNTSKSTAQAQSRRNDGEYMSRKQFPS